MEKRNGSLQVRAAEELRGIEILISHIKGKLAIAPKGTLNIRSVRGKAQYFKNEEGKRTYIPKKDMKMVNILAQKDYYVMLLKLLEKKSAALKRFQEHYPGDTIDSVYMGLTPERQKLVVPVRPTDEQFLKSWLEKPYEGNDAYWDAQSGYYTDKGERVRSKSEVIIANTLLREGIPYKYECPLNLGGRTVYPDFTIMDMSTRSERYLEHFGMMDDPKYCSRFWSKLCMYQENGIFLGMGLIATYESSRKKLDTRMVKATLEEYFVIG